MSESFDEVLKLLQVRVYRDPDNPRIKFATIGTTAEVILQKLAANSFFFLSSFPFSPSRLMRMSLIYVGFFVGCFISLGSIVCHIIYGIAYPFAKLTFTDSAIPAVRGWLTERGYSWPAEISSKATLD